MKAVGTESATLIPYRAAIFIDSQAKIKVREMGGLRALLAIGERWA